MANIGNILLNPEDGWKRIDKSDINFKYSYLNSSLTSIKFIIKNITKLRMIGSYFQQELTDYCSNGSIKIDGVSCTNFSNINNYGTDNLYTALIAETIGISADSHVVEIISNDTKPILFDSIDIDNVGSIEYCYSKVGDLATSTPEPGWKRIDNLDPLFTYTNGYTEPMNGAYNKSMAFCMGATITVKGTKRLRLFSMGTSSGIIKIDGIEKVRYNGSANFNCILVAEIDDLTLDSHTIEIVSQDVKQISLDFIEIDDGNNTEPINGVGSVLLTPEQGWKRISSSNSNFKYSGMMPY